MTIAISDQILCESTAERKCALWTPLVPQSAPWTPKVPLSKSFKKQVAAQKTILQTVEDRIKLVAFLRQTVLLQGGRSNIVCVPLVFCYFVKSYYSTGTPAGVAKSLKVTFSKNCRNLYFLLTFLTADKQHQFAGRRNYRAQLEYR